MSASAILHMHDALDEHGTSDPHLGTRREGAASGLVPAFG
jgi:hypothetical protein